MSDNSIFFIGIDLGDQHSFVTMLDGQGEVVEETRLPTTQIAFQRKFSAIPACRIAMEVGTHSRWISHLLKDLGHDVLVANSRKLKASYHNPRKGDPSDAETLARLARLDPQCSPPSIIALLELKPIWLSSARGMPLFARVRRSSIMPVVWSRSSARDCLPVLRIASPRKQAAISPASSDQH